MQKDVVVSVVIGSYNRLEFLKATIETVRADITKIRHEIIIVDGGSNDGSIEWLIAQKDIITILQHNRGEWNGQPIERQSWGYFMNLGFRAASGKYICMLSDDCLVIPGAIKNGITKFNSQLKSGKKVGALAFYWRNWPEQKKYWIGTTYNDTTHVNHGMYLKKALEAINYIDAQAYFFYHADSDICLRLMKAGYTISDSPSSFIEHYSDANAAVRATNMERQQQDWATYLNRWDKLREPKHEWIERTYHDPHATAEHYWRKLLPVAAPEEPLPTEVNDNNTPKSLSKMLNLLKGARKK